MITLSCAQQDIPCDFCTESDSPAQTVSKFISHCIEAHPDFIGGLRETMPEEEIRAMLLEQAKMN